MKARRNLFVRSLVSFLLIVLLARSVDVREALRPVPHVRWAYVVLMALLANFDRLLMSYKWNLLLRARGLEMPFVDVVRSYYLGTVWGVFLPTGLGGDLVRSFVVRGYGRRAGDVLSSVVLERILGLAACLTLGIVASILLPMIIDDPNGTDNFLAVAFLIPLVLVLSLLTLSFSSAPNRWLGGRIPLLPQRVLVRLKEVYESYQAYGRNRRMMLRFTGWSLAEQCIPVVCVFLVSIALGANARFIDFVVFVPIIMIPARLPISLDGFGLRESLYVYFFTYVGISAADALRLGFVSHVLGILSVLPGFLYFSLLARGTETASDASRAAGQGAVESPRRLWSRASGTGARSY